MGRSRLGYVETSCMGGINQVKEQASQDQCQDALNVWGVNGLVERRPGYVGALAQYIGFTSLGSGISCYSKAQDAITGWIGSHDEYERQF